MVDPSHTVFFLFAEGLSDLFSFANLMIIDELELQGSMGLKKQRHLVLKQKYLEFQDWCYIRR